MMSNKLAVQKVLLETLDDFKTLANQNNLTFFVDAGTLLGSVRHNGFIPHDEDIDLGVVDTDESTLFTVLRKLPEKYNYCEFHSGYKIFLKENPKIKKYNWSYPYIDIMLYHEVEEKGKKLLRYKSGKWRSFKHTLEDMYPLRNYNFEGRVLKGPMNPIPFLDGGYKYKKKWDEWSHTHNWCHKEEKALKIRFVCLFSKEQSIYWRKLYSNPPRKIKFIRKKKNS